MLFFQSLTPVAEHNDDDDNQNSHSMYDGNDDDDNRISHSMDDDGNDDDRISHSMDHAIGIVTIVYYITWSIAALGMFLHKTI